jgi:hypothetical protein
MTSLLFPSLVFLAAHLALIAVAVVIIVCELSQAKKQEAAVPGRLRGRVKSSRS